MADTAQRFYCHQCLVEIQRLLPDFVCPRCKSGFIEELGPESRGATGGQERAASPLEDEEDMGGLSVPLFGGMGGSAHFLMPGFGPPGGGGGGGPGGSLNRGRYHVTREGPLRPFRTGSRERVMEQFLQDLLLNVAGMASGDGGEFQGRLYRIPGNQAGGLQLEGIQIHGNLGDYAWGRGGLDAVITQLLNQMDGAGAPPMAHQNIQDIPSVSMTQTLLDRNPNCSVCWEDYKLDEQVKKLECEHCFHADCIIPWLQIHGTCPVCRKVLNGVEDGEGGGNRGQDGDGQGDSHNHSEPGNRESNSQTQSGSQQFHDVGGASGGGSFMDLIQSGISSFMSSFSSPTAPGSSSGSPTAASSSSTTGTSSTTSSSSSSVSNSDSSDTGLGTRNTPHSQEDEPASRRPRMEDFDLE